MMRSLVKRFLLDRDLAVSRPPGQFNVWDVRLRKAKARGLHLGSVLDGGAAVGTWTREFKTVYPDARVLAVDPRDDVQPELQRMAQELSGITVAKTLLGESAGEAAFNEALDQSSMLPDPSGAAFGTVKQVPITTIDALVQSTGFGWPDLIKLDVQGAELVALRGAGESLRHAQALLLELSFVEFQRGVPLFAEVVCWLRERGFRVYDIPSLWHRPLDGALGQGDFLFLRDGHPLLADQRWSADLR
jgi:FkbM family methyltransferase